MYDKILNKDILFPDPKKTGIKISEECVDFISCCLRKDPQQRLGSKGSAEILDHPWFADIDKDKLFKKEYVPAFKPKLSKNASDISNFDSMFTNEEVVHTILPQSTVSKIKNANDKFKGFS